MGCFKSRGFGVFGCRRGYFGKINTRTENKLPQDDTILPPEEENCSGRKGDFESCCRPCAKGKMSVEGSSYTCSSCAPGTFAEGYLPGFVTSTRNYVDESGATLCTACAAGKYRLSDQSDGPECVTCPSGYYSNQGAAVCSICPAGTALYPKITDGQRCLECNRGLCEAGSTTCKACEIGRFSASYRQESCQRCGEFETTLGNGSTSCVCIPGFYREVDGRCAICTAGMDCSQAGNTIENLKLVSGYWRITNLSSEVYRCNIPEACSNASSACAIGNEGILCGTCSPDYYRPGSSKPCARCDKSRGAAIGTALLYLALMLAGFFVLLIVNRKAPNGLIRPFVHGMQSLTVILLFGAPLPELMLKLQRFLSGLSLGMGLISPQCANIGRPTTLASLY